MAYQQDFTHVEGVEPHRVRVHALRIRAVGVGQRRAGARHAPTRAARHVRHAGRDDVRDAQSARGGVTRVRIVDRVRARAARRGTVRLIDALLLPEGGQGAG